MSDLGPDAVTDLLLRWTDGDQTALDDLTPVIYDDLRRLARALLSRERPDHTLSATALVHEAYLKLIDQRRVQWRNLTTSAMTTTRSRLPARIGLGPD